MKVDVKKLLTSNGLGRNLATAARGLLDDNVKEITVTTDNAIAADAKGTATLDLALELKIGDVVGRIKLDHISVIID